MHVCVLTDGFPPWSTGGAETIAAQLARGYRDRGDRVSVVTTVTERREAGSSTVDGVTVARVYSPRPRPLLPYLTVYNPYTVSECRGLLDEFSPDVVHAHNTHWLSNRVLRAAADGRPLVKTYHDAGTVAYGDFDGFVDRVPVGRGVVPRSAYEVRAWRQALEQGVRYNPLRNRSNRRFHERYVDVGVAVSRALHRALDVNGVSPRRVIRNGVETDRWNRGDGDDFRSQYGLGDSRVVLFGGRTSYTKGGYHLAKAFERLAGSTADPVRLVVTGDRDYVPTMRDAAGAAGSAVVATGWLDRVEYRDALAAATVVATPSVFLDPFPTVNLEAFAGRTPVVTSRFGGARELVDHGEDGYVVDPRDVCSLARALRRLVERPDRTSAFGARGGRKVAETFTHTDMVDAYRDLLAATLD